jgi:hypothetical protein
MVPVMAHTMLLKKRLAVISNTNKILFLFPKGMGDDAIMGFWYLYVIWKNC